MIRRADTKHKPNTEVRANIWTGTPSLHETHIPLLVHQYIESNTNRTTLKDVKMNYVLKLDWPFEIIKEFHKASNFNPAPVLWPYCYFLIIWGMVFALNLGAPKVKKWSSLYSTSIHNRRLLKSSIYVTQYH